MNVSPIMAEIWRVRPVTVLDLGCGIGAYGLLCREMLDIGQGRLYPTAWVTNIIGVEGFIQYNNPVHSFFYNTVLYEDFTKEAYNNFDLVLMIDCLEHIPKDQGHALLDRLLESNKRVIVSCPTGANYVEQGAVFGNEFERHRAHWTADDFELRGGRIIHNGVCVVASIRGQGKGTDNLWLR
jgi:2-polyprenyl-3-methyl-5-hydroxy-6-metoxy-1,4-benzoquinol methylase